MERQSSTELLDLLDEILDASSVLEGATIASTSVSADPKNPFTNPKMVAWELESSESDELSMIKNPGMVGETTDSDAGIDVNAKREARRQYIAAASRKARAKKRMVYERMSLKTVELEREQEEFQKQIAKLQNEIQTLKRCRGDLGRRDTLMENQLLRAEVKRYKTFVDILNQSVRSLPEYTREEKLRLARTGIESSVGQMIGLGYTSIQDCSWKSVITSFPDQITHVAPGHKLHCRYQYLPHGSTRETAKRINYRSDVFALEGTPKDIANKLWQKIGNEETLKQVPLIDTANISWKKVEDFFEDSYQKGSGVTNAGESETCSGEEKDEMIKVYTYTEQTDDGTRYDSICILSYDSVMLSPDGFPRSAERLVQKNTGEHVMTPEDVPGFVITSTFAHPGVENLITKSPGVNRIRGSMYEGYIIQESLIPGMSVVTCIASTPIESGSLAFFDPALVHPIDENGNISETHLQLLYYEMEILRTN